jgi:hypothetical protein
MFMLLLILYHVLYQQPYQLNQKLYFWRFNKFRLRFTSDHVPYQKLYQQVLKPYLWHFDMFMLLLL